MAIIPYVLERFESLGTPVKWLSREQYELASLPYRAVAWADALVGIREQGGNNKGWDVEHITEFAGLGKGGGYAWCAMFVYYILVKAGFDPKSLPPKGQCAAVRNWLSWANSRGLVASAPKRGRLFLWLNSNGQGHMGICISAYLGVVFRTVEGNTDGEAGSREGDGSYKRTRTKIVLTSKHRHAFIDLEKLK